MVVAESVGGCAREGGASTHSSLATPRTTSVWGCGVAGPESTEEVERLVAVVPERWRRCFSPPGPVTEARVSFACRG